MAKKPTEKPTKFADNLERLLGLHGLTSRRFSALADVSESVLSKWQSGDRNPSFTSALKIGDIFKIDPGRLARADFGDLLERELADAERYRQVEETLARLAREWEGESEEKVVPIKKRTTRKKAG
jgi:transcriptional regulator with XRE-family HTH domain